MNHIFRSTDGANRDSTPFVEQPFLQQHLDEFMPSPVDRCCRLISDAFRPISERVTVEEMRPGDVYEWAQRNSGSVAENLRQLLDIESMRWTDAAMGLDDLVSLIVSSNHHQQSAGSLDTQLDLPGVSTEFSPSRALLDIWVSSLNQLAEASKKLQQMPPYVELAQEFSQDLKALLGTLAQKVRSKGRSSEVIARGGMFLLPYQIQLCDRFFITPAESGDFLRLLAGDLISAIRAGTVLQGAWGRVVLRPHDVIVFELNPPMVISRPEFEKAIELE